MSDFLSIEYMTHFSNDGLVNITNRISLGVKQAMQEIIDKLVKDIKGQFDDTALAETVVGIVQAGGIGGSDDFFITGNVTSTWAGMKWYEAGRQPGGKMPPIDALVAYANKHGIKPDPEKSKTSFAFAINAARKKKDKHFVPIDVLVRWMDTKNIEVPADFALRSMAFAMGKKIVKEGIAGHHYFAIALAQNAELINNSIEGAVISVTGKV
jgi:hypothetical protein